MKVHVSVDVRGIAHLNGDLLDLRDVAHGNRLTALDATFLHLEAGGAHMHVASMLRLRGRASALRGAASTRSRAAAPRPPLPPAAGVRAVRPGPPGVGRRPALQRPATTSATPRCPRRGRDEELKHLAGRAVRPARWTATSRCGRSGSSRALEGGRFALHGRKTHHALVDGISGVDITTVLFDAAAGPGRRPRRPTRRGSRGPLPSGAQLLAEALLERATRSRAEARAGCARWLRAPRQAFARVVRGLGRRRRAWPGRA